MSQHHAWMTINSKKKKMRVGRRVVCSLLTNCPSNVCNWLVMGDMTFCGLWMNLFVLFTNGQKHVADAWRVWSRTFITQVNTDNIAMCGNTAQQCRLGLFPDSDFARDLEDSKSTPGGVLCIFGSHMFVPISWMCKKQTSVSHSSTEADIISVESRSHSLGFSDWNI